MGLENGLQLTLDLHSNLQSFGTLLRDFSAFSVFVGQPTEFPAMKKRSIYLQPGQQHFLSLSSQVTLLSQPGSGF